MHSEPQRHSRKVGRNLRGQGCMCKISTDLTAGRSHPFAQLQAPKSTMAVVHGRGFGGRLPRWQAKRGSQSLTFALCCTFYDPRKIEKLYFGIIVVYYPRYAGQRCEFIGSSLRLGACECCQYGGFSYRRESWTDKVSFSILLEASAQTVFIQSQRSAQAFQLKWLTSSLSLLEQHGQV